MSSQSSSSTALLSKYQCLFDQLERQPLTLKQRQACISDSLNTLVLAGAGTGKTSTLMGRLAFLICSQQAQAHEVLLLAFAVEAAGEMQERTQQLKLETIYPGAKQQGQGLKSFRARTFHSLGLSIIQQVKKCSNTAREGQEVRLSRLTQDKALDDFLSVTFHHYLQQADYIRAVHDYFTLYEQVLYRRPSLRLDVLSTGLANTNNQNAEDFLGYPWQDSLAHRQLQQVFMRITKWEKNSLAHRQLQHRQSLDKRSQDSSSPYDQYIRQHVWRTLADEYVANPLELLVANSLYQLAILYRHQAHYKQDVFLAAYQPYRSSFLLRDEHLYIDVYDCDEADMQALPSYAKRRQAIRNLHRTQQTCALEIYQDKVLDAGTGQIVQEIRITNDEWLNPDLPDLHFTSHEAQPAVWARSVQAMLNAVFGSWRQEGSLQPVFHSPGRADRLLKVLGELLSSLNNERPDMDVLSQSLCAADLHLLTLVEPLHKAYQDELQKEQAIDFELMIQEATSYVRSGTYLVPWSDILIDEFQDISTARFELIQAIREQKPSIRLFCVGDDWQSIYQFAGSQLRYTTHFEDYVGSTQRYTLDLTFRFHQGLCDISTQFIQHNPKQSRKDLKATREYAGTALRLIPENTPISLILAQIRQDNVALMRHHTQTKTGCSCLIMARFNHLLPSAIQLQTWQLTYPDIQLKCSTIHAAKGKEADYVIVLGNQGGEFGLPSEKISHTLINTIRNDPEDFPFAQERRAFYVAITRARQEVFLLYKLSVESVFIQELKTQGYTYTAGLSPSQSRLKAVFNSWFKRYKRRLRVLVEQIKAMT